MDRQGIIAISLALAVFVLWEMHSSTEMRKYQAAKLQAAELARLQNPAAAGDAPAASSGQAAPVAPGQPAPAPDISSATPPGAEGKVERLDSPAVQYSFTDLGGGISRATLLEHVAERRGGAAAADDSHVNLNGFGDIPIGAIVEHPEEDARVPFTSTLDGAAGEITYERTDGRQLKTTKTFRTPKSTGLREKYLVALDVTFTNGGAAPLQTGGYFVHTGSAGPIHSLDQATYTGFDWYNGSNTFKDVSTFATGGMLGFGRVDTPVFTQSVSNVEWVAVANQYFATIITPAEVKGTSIWARKFTVTPPAEWNAAAAGGRPPLAVQGAIGMPGLKLAPGESAKQHFDLYLGPREFERLKSLGQSQDEIMDFGTFKIVSKALLASMNWLHARLGSYAAAIIVLTLIIRSLMWPLQNKSTESMKKMQSLTPKMNELKEKYADDPQRMNQEVMKLYKKYGVNPISGCLPMVIQIPIFFGLFRMLGKAVELRNSHFLWVHDLSQPDTVAMLLGKPLNILPLCMAATMFWQMRLSPKTGDAVQQRVFMFMPVIFVVFCYNYASALALYWTVQNLFSIGQLYVTRNKNTAVLQKA